MNRVDEGFEPPDALVEWCRSRTFPLHVLDDEATVDLDWWNAHLKDAGHTISQYERATINWWRSHQW